MISRLISLYLMCGCAMLFIVFYFFFFKQKTAYEMRISDWSSDVCSSDLYKTRAWEVARATSAAPTYLKGHEHTPSGRIFIDGGVWANNPVMVALVDVLSAYDISPDQIDILSIGTGNQIGRAHV